MANFLTALILGAWVCAIALISVQNATPVSLRFLTFQSVAIPVGVVLAFCATLGMVSMAIALPRPRRRRRNELDEF
ncbi:DUF1049 domain-containing protein [Microcoleus sp. FACHB-1515]|uniref:lipopolysaccharide assembly protein LapA domain-containing protein n=1 Tax=Cyanophyceae TaxID=3028117 RepID=UPI001683F351|nr:lipopolysaccharide assembly protein LapA domain-containing protein [Microcoleus sp. FACHB-1515]MBD2088540.1 DUF1049 domain-containing protein [Microcoleus sp. FACHB-1515]